eukprot:11602713-Ditylum_brightwellii.AAC.1
MADADKMKIAVVSFQQVPVGISPYLALVGQPQTTNKNNDFNARVMNACAKFVEQTPDSELFNYAAVMLKMFGWAFANTTAAKKRNLAITDPNYIMKNA